MTWAKMLEKEYMKIADENKKSTQFGNTVSQKSDKPIRTDDKVAKEVGFGSRDTYNKAKFILDNADDELIKQLDEKQISVHAAYQKIKKNSGYQQIEVRVMTVRDYEHQLKLEISENENRKEFSFSERVDWAKRLEQVEKIKAEERKKKGKETDHTENLPEGQKGETKDIVAEQSGFGSGKNREVFHPSSTAHRSI